MVSILTYFLHAPNQPPNGGTWLGYTLGTVGAAIIIWLLYLGRRKRDFRSRFGTVRGWVSAHVYLGTSLLVIVTLHAGFQFGNNIHTVAYVLMCLVIASGFYGVWAYAALPEDRNELKRSQSIDEIFLQLEEVDGQLQHLTVRTEADIHEVVTSAIERTEVGGGILAQLSGRDRSRFSVDGTMQSNRNQQPALNWLVVRRANLTGDEAIALADIIRVFGNRQRLLKTIRDDIRMHGMLSVWLWFHVPVSFALLAALIAHIVSVFLYR